MFNKKKRILDIYNQAAKNYDQFQTEYFAKYASKDLNNTYKQLFSNKWFSNGDMVLEVGVGTGLNLFLYQPNINLHGIDFSKGMLDLALAKTHKIKNYEIKLWLEDAEFLNMKDSKYDIVVSTFCLCAASNPAKIFHEMYRVLKKNGLIILFEYNVSTVNDIKMQQQLLCDTILKFGLIFNKTPVITWNMLFNIHEFIDKYPSLEKIYECNIQKSIFESFNAIILKKKNHE